MGCTVPVFVALEWIHNERYNVSSHQPHDCLLSRLSSASLAFVREIHWGPVNCPHKWPVTRKSFHLMTSSWFWKFAHSMAALPSYTLKMQERLRYRKSIRIRAILNDIHIFFRHNIKCVINVRRKGWPGISRIRVFIWEEVISQQKRKPSYKSSPPSAAYMRQWMGVSIGSDIGLSPIQSQVII